METPTLEPAAKPPVPGAFAITKTRTRFFGLTSDECIRAFFGGNAFIAVVVLALITIFLLREGFDFFSQNRWQSLSVYRIAGLEYVDYVRHQEAEHQQLSRELGEIRLEALNDVVKEKKLQLAQANAELAPFDEFAGRYSDAVLPVRTVSSEWEELVVALKNRFSVNEDKKVERQQLMSVGRTADAEKVAIEELNFDAELKPLIDGLPAYKEANRQFAAALLTAVETLPALPSAGLQARLKSFAQHTKDYIATFPTVEKKLEQWDPKVPIAWYSSFSSFLFGREWQTASFWQDFYGILPLLVGSLMVSAVALVIAVPLGVGAAIYVNQIARPWEQKMIKPTIEFISAIPSVVLGFFGIAVFGEALRLLSQVSWLQWMPGFPIAERLNALTAGCLLALIAVPTIFTLAEDAINNVPRAFKEASFALGASRMQTVLKIIVPASISGIISAVLLGLGRVIGETMVVLLCAGNRIAIPDFTHGFAAFTQPVHTMTGIIAQEMGEVAGGSIHYRALFMVGVVLFFLSLLINYTAQTIVRRYRISVG